MMTHEDAAPEILDGPRDQFGRRHGRRRPARHRPVVLARPDALPALAAMGYAVCDLAGQAWPATATRGAQPPGDLAVAIYGASESDFAKVTDATLARVRLGRMWHSIVS